MQSSTVKFSNLWGSRLDAEYYKEEYIELDKVLENSKYDVVKLGSIIENISYGASVKNDYVSNDGIPLLRIKDIKRNKIEAKNIVYLNNKLKKDIGNCYVKDGDFLISRSGTIGIVALVNDDYSNFAFGSFMIKFNINNNFVSKLFLQYYLNSKIPINYFKKEKIGAIQGNITIPIIQNLKIPVPPVNIQEQVVSIMDSAYKQKEDAEAMSKELLGSIDSYLLGELGIEMKKVESKPISIVNFNSLWGSRFDAGYYKEEYRELGSALDSGKYDVVKLKEVCDLMNGYAFKSNDYVKKSEAKLITIKNIKSYGLNLSKVTYLPDIYYETFNNFHININDILIAMTGATIGKTCLIKNSDKLLLNQRVGKIKNFENINNHFLFYYLDSFLFMKQIEKDCLGGAQPNISREDILNLKIPLPPLEIQNKIAKHISKIRAEASSIVKEADSNLASAKDQVEKIILGV